MVFLLVRFVLQEMPLKLVIFPITIFANYEAITAAIGQKSAELTLYFGHDHASVE
jgi:hypothetical protein